MTHGVNDVPHYDVKYIESQSRWSVVAHTGLSRNTLKKFDKKTDAVSWARRRSKDTAAQEIHVYNVDGGVQEVKQV